MQGAQKLRSEAHKRVRRSDEVAAQRRRWTFYEASAHFIENPPLMEIVWPVIQEHRSEQRKTIMLATS
jgi:hypothetical protein